MDMFRITARWSGFTGAPGYSNFYFGTAMFDGGLLGDVANDAATKVGAALRNITSILPEGVTVRTEAEAAVINSDTGEILDYANIGSTYSTTGTSTGGYAAPVGGVINWRTSDVRFGRRIRGRTFLVPLASNAFEDDGTLTPEARGDLEDFGDELVGGVVGSEFGVWSRPRNGSGGVFATVNGHNVPDLAAVLRSRRD